MAENKGEQSAATDRNSGVLDVAFKAGVSAAEDIHKRAFDIPLQILEGMGAPQEKVDMLRDKSQTMIGELYAAINSVAAQVGPVSSAETEKESTQND